MRKLLFLLALLIPVIGHAEIIPPRGKVDPRVRVVDYNEWDVVRLTTFYGVSTHVRFGTDEVIESVATGDSDAWEIVPKGSHLFVKPKAMMADTNVTVITNRRVYQFLLMVAEKDASDAKAWRDASLTFSLSFRYPDDLAAVESVKALANKQANEVKEVQRKLAVPRVDGRNQDYWLAGSSSVSPSAIHDDGRFTYFSFSNTTDMPEIYEVDEAGNESRVNKNVAGRTIVVHRVVRKFVLRKGDSVACVVNQSFDVELPIDSASGTVSPDVERVVREAK